MSSFLESLVVALPGFLFAIVAHEWAHGYVALKYGDDTAKQHGRLTLNPVSHIDPIGTVVWPLICVMIGGIIFGYAKPVPVNPARFKNYRSGLFWVSFAGPLMNILLGIVSAFLMAVVYVYVPESTGWALPLLKILQTSLVINFVLAIFNLIPFPPLDGSRMVTSFLSYDQAIRYEGLQRYALLFLLALWFTNIAQYIFMPAQIVAPALIQLFVSILA